MITSSNRNSLIKEKSNYKVSEESVIRSTTNLYIFEDVDKHSLEVTTHNYETFEDFMWNLVFVKNFDDAQKTRSIFRWITTNNFKKIKLDHFKHGSAEETVYLFVNGEIDHAELLSRLLWKVGIRCEIIEGLTKDSPFKAGDEILTPHRWNAVLIDHEWKLIDICWSRKYFCRQFAESESPIDEFYFFSNPEHLIFTHFPSHLEWQLLNPPTPHETFLSLPVVESHFFTSGFTLKEQLGVLETYNGSAIVEIGRRNYLADRYHDDFLRYTFTRIDSVEVKGHVLQETKRDGEVFHIRCPQIGAYHFTIHHISSYNPHTLQQKRTFNSSHFNKLLPSQRICQYKIICHANPKPRPFPMSNPSIGWGSHLLALNRFQILPSHASAILTSDGDFLDLIFTKSRSEVRMFASLSGGGKDSKDLRSSVRVLERRTYAEGNDDGGKMESHQVLVSITPPKPGEYCLEIYANDPNVDGNDFILICRHLVVCRRDDRRERQTSTTPSDGRIEQVIFYNNIAINTDQFDWKTFVPKRCFPFKSNIKFKPAMFPIKSNCYNNVVCVRCCDPKIFEVEESQNWEMRSDIVYQSRLRHKLQTTRAPTASDTRSLILLSGKDLALKKAKN